MDEFIAVTQRPKFKKFFKPKDVQALPQLMDSFAELITVNTNIAACRDAKDDFLLSLAIDGKADFLITGDKDLLVLGKVKTTTILTITDFLTKFK